MPRFLRPKMIVTSPITTNHHQSPTNHLENMWPITFQSPQRCTARIIPAGIIIHIRVLPAPDKAHIGIEFHWLSEAELLLRQHQRNMCCQRYMGEAFRDSVIPKNPELLWKEKTLHCLIRILTFPARPPTPGLNIAMHDGARALEKKNDFVIVSRTMAILKPGASGRPTYK